MEKRLIYYLFSGGLLFRRLFFILFFLLFSNLFFTLDKINQFNLSIDVSFYPHINESFISLSYNKYINNKISLLLSTGYNPFVYSFCFNTGGRFNIEPRIYDTFFFENLIGLEINYLYFSPFVIGKIGYNLILIKNNNFYINLELFSDIKIKSLNNVLKYIFASGISSGIVF